MKLFAALLDGLVYQPSRLGKLRLLADYFARAPDPDRGYALAALAGTLDIPAVKPAMLRDLIVSRTDPVLFLYSYDYVGDLAETIALMWPKPPAGGETSAPLLWEVVTTLRNTAKSRAPQQVAAWLDSLDTGGRWALLKLITGGLRIGISARLAKTAFAEWGNVDLGEVEELWHGLAPPYTELFAWASGRGPKPAATAAFRPFMLAHAIEEPEFAALNAPDFLAEWKWDGIRVQIAGGLAPRLYARSGDEISHAFPDVTAAADFDAVLDGELLVRGVNGEPASFADLQQRLNRKTVTRRMMDDFPAFVRVYDVLTGDGEDLRGRPLAERRQWLERFFGRRRTTRNEPPRFDLSPTVPFSSWTELTAIRASSRQAGMEGLMIKRRDAPYVAGRPKGLWFKWKRDPLTADAVLMYAQRGHGKRSSFYSDYTFGVWKGDELVPIGKAYFGFTDAELKLLDKWVRDNTTERFGPVRSVKPGLVLEVAFDAVQRSTRHKAGVALRFPRIARIRWDKPSGEADHLETVERLISQ